VRNRAFISALAFALLGGCAHQSSLAPLPSAPSAMQGPRDAPSFRVVYSFKGGADGADPQAPLTATDGVFWSTTQLGGTKNMGTVFVVNPDGTERVVHSFTGSKTDGAAPVAGLIAYSGAFYGVTQSGGTANRGTLFQIKRDGTERIVYNFTEPTGASPVGDLIAVGGVFYGTTILGGAHGAGTVFSATTDGHEKVLHSFAGPDGARPEGGLELIGHELYGTTFHGGANDAGTVFEIAPDGTERVLYSFKGRDGDGGGPANGLAALSGALYGTTLRGGMNCCGTVFEVETNGTEHIVYSLDRDTGNFPFSALTPSNGVLYGTASKGGSDSVGTVFEVKPNGALRAFFSFSGRDGSGPRSNPIVYKGKLYGATSSGGSTHHGVIYEITP
jgi:uncharacterized repeat protein (TIGR03803 family)